MSPSPPQLTPAKRPLPWLLPAAPLLVFLTLPLLALLLWATPSQIWHNVRQPMVRQAIGLSLLTSTLTTGLALLLGTPLAYIMAKRPFRFKRLVDALIDLPTVLPPAVAGVALLITFGRRGLVGGWLAGVGIEIAFTTVAVVLAQLFIAAPLFVKTAVTGFAAIEPELEAAAALDGASELQAVRHVSLPLAARALVTGAVLTWARALGEFGATIIFAGNLPGRTQTMPIAIYIGFEIDLSIALTLSVILMSLSFLVLVLVKFLFRETAV